MSKQILRGLSQQNQPDTSEAHPDDLPVADRRPADVEMARVLKTAPLRMASDPSSGAIAHWKHGALHDVVEPMADHVIMTYPTGVQRLERRDGKSVAIGTARPGVVTIIPAGSSARWDIPGPVNVVQLYLPHTTLERVAGEADTAATGRSSGANGTSRPITSRLLMSAADALEGNEALDALFRQQLTDLLATRLLAAHAGSPTTFQPIMGGLSPHDAAPRHRALALGQRYGRLARGAGFGCRPVALPLLPRLQGKHRAFAACLAAPAPARAGHEHAARHRRIDRVGRGGAWLRLADGLRRGVQEADRRNPERLATARALAAIALQARQSLWRSGRSGPLNHHGTHATTDGDKR